MQILLILALFASVFGVEFLVPNANLVYETIADQKAAAAALNFTTYETGIETYFSDTAQAGSLVNKTLTTQSVKPFLPSTYAPMANWQTGVFQSPDNSPGSVLLVSYIAPTDLPAGVTPTGLASSLMQTQSYAPAVGVVVNGTLVAPSTPYNGTLGANGTWMATPTTPPSLASTTVSVSPLGGLANNTVAIVREVSPGGTAPAP